LSAVVICEHGGYIGRGHVKGEHRNYAWMALHLVTIYTKGVAQMPTIGLCFWRKEHGATVKRIANNGPRLIWALPSL